MRWINKKMICKIKLTIYKNKWNKNRYKLSKYNLKWIKN